MKRTLSPMYKFNSLDATDREDDFLKKNDDDIDDVGFSTSSPSASSAPRLPPAVRAKNYTSSSSSSSANKNNNTSCSNNNVEDDALYGDGEERLRTAIQVSSSNNNDNNDNNNKLITSTRMGRTNNNDNNNGSPRNSNKKDDDGGGPDSGSSGSGSSNGSDDGGENGSLPTVGALLAQQQQLGTNLQGPLNEFLGKESRNVVDLANISGHGPTFAETYRTETSIWQNFKESVKWWELIIALIVLAAIPAISIIIVNEMRSNRLREIDERCGSALQKTMSAIGNDFSLVASITRSFAVLFFGAVNSTLLPDLGQTNITLRQVMFINEKFEEYCVEEMRRSPSVISFSTRPANILTQIYPHGTSPFGLDMNSFVAAEVAKANSVRDGYISGPRQLKQGFPGLVTWWPIWLQTTDPYSPLAISSEYWGTVGIVVNLSRFVYEIDVAGTIKNYTDSLSDSSSFQYAEIGYHMHNTATQNESWILGSDNVKSTDGVLSASNRLYGVENTVYVVPHSAFLSPDEIAVSIVTLLALLAVWLIVARLMTLARIRSWRTKNTAHAPPSGTVCLVLCSIADVSGYWHRQTDPEKMPVTLGVYAAIIRALIADFQCYEVTTDGQSFLIACKDIDMASKLSIAVHEAMAECTMWPIDLQNKTVGLLNKVAIVVGLAHAITDTESGYPFYQGFAVDQVRVLETRCHGGCTIYRADQYEKVPEEFQEWYQHVEICAEEIPLVGEDTKSGGGSGGSGSGGTKSKRSLTKTYQISQFVLTSHQNSIIPVIEDEVAAAGGGRRLMKNFNDVSDSTDTSSISAGKPPSHKSHHSSHSGVGGVKPYVPGKGTSGNTILDNTTNPKQQQVTSPTGSHKSNRSSSSSSRRSSSKKSNRPEDIPREDLFFEDFSAGLVKGGGSGSIESGKTSSTLVQQNTSSSSSTMHSSLKEHGGNNNNSGSHNNSYNSSTNNSSNILLPGAVLTNENRTTSSSSSPPTSSSSAAQQQQKNSKKNKKNSNNKNKISKSPSSSKQNGDDDSNDSSDVRYSSPDSAEAADKYNSTGAYYDERGTAVIHFGDDD